ncbi:MAG: hypothetical protein LBP56_10215 [Odoribacteraceae bacterium]|jgi:chromosome segregation ATPase|nr:hypothetical protein [Odoribacteraceae bacterium]
MKKVWLYTFVFSLATLLLASCVSKKKFDHLARAKRAADREIVQLLGEREALDTKVKQLQTEFNTARYKLTENNAAKEKQIADLYSTLRAREDRGSALETELQDVEEQARYVEKTHAQRISSLEERLRTVVTERDEARAQLAELRNVFERENRRWKAETEQLANEITTKDARIKALNEELKTVKSLLATTREALETTKKELQERSRRTGTSK